MTDLARQQAAEAREWSRLSAEEALRIQAERDRDKWKEQADALSARLAQAEQICEADKSALRAERDEAGDAARAAIKDALLLKEKAEARLREYEEALDLGSRRVDDALAALYGIDYEEESRVGRAVTSLEEFVNARAAVARGADG